MGDVFLRNVAFVSAVFKRQSGYHSSVDYRSLWHYVGFLQNTEYRKQCSGERSQFHPDWRQGGAPD